MEVPDGADRSASTFEYLYGHPTLPYSRDRFIREINELHEAGLLQDALYVTLDGRPAPLISGLRFEQEAATEISLRRLAPVEKELPREKETFRVAYRVYTIRDSGEVRE